MAPPCCVLNPEAAPDMQSKSLERAQRRGRWFGALSLALVLFLASACDTEGGPTSPAGGPDAGGDVDAISAADLSPTSDQIATADGMSSDTGRPDAGGGTVGNLRPPQGAVESARSTGYRLSFTLGAPQASQTQTSTHFTLSRFRHAAARP